jgi:hypothetical protein
MHGSSRHHAQICTKVARPVDLGPVTDDRDQAGPLGAPADGRKHAPAVEGCEREVDHDAVEAFPPEQSQGGIAVAGDRHVGVDRIGKLRAPLDHEHARNHRAPPP